MKRVNNFLFVLTIMLLVVTVRNIPQTSSKETNVKGNLLSVTDNEGRDYSLITNFKKDVQIYEKTAIEENKNDYKVIEEVIVDVNNKTKSKKKTSSPTPTPNTGKVGDIGRLSIPSVGYSAAVYNCSGSSYAHSQGVTDAKDSASYITCAGSRTAYIGDHNTDGFANMKKSVPGSTLAYITRPDGSVDTYMCVSKYGNGTYAGTIYDDRGVEIFASGCDLAMVTCNQSYVSVTITYWNKI